MLKLLDQIFFRLLGMDVQCIFELQIRHIFVSYFIFIIIITINLLHY